MGASRQTESELLDEMTQKAVKLHLRQRNALMLEAVIAALLDVETMEDAAEILEQHAEQLRDYG